MQQEQLKVAGDVLSISTVIGALMSWLPPLAALFTIIWTAIRIYETATVKRLLAKWRQRKE